MIVVQDMTSSRDFIELCDKKTFEVSQSEVGYSFLKLYMFAWWSIFIFKETFALVLIFKETFALLLIEVSLQDLVDLMMLVAAVTPSMHMPTVKKLLGK